MTESPSGFVNMGGESALIMGVGGCFCARRVFLCEEGVFAGFSSGYVTESPSRDEIALRSCVLGRGNRVFIGVGGRFCTGRVFLLAFLPVT